MGIRELPHTVGTKVWRGEWLLWRFLTQNQDGVDALGGVRSVLELGAGAGACGVLLASQGLDVTVSDMRIDDDIDTWDNLVFNVEANADVVSQMSGGSLRPLVLD